MPADPPAPAVPTVLFLCTGNAARSVIAGAALAARLPAVRVETAGTLVIDGLLQSTRTRAALAAVGLAAPDHRSREAHAPDLEAATLVVGLAPEHVAWVRREHPAGGGPDRDAEAAVPGPAGRIHAAEPAGGRATAGQRRAAAVGGGDRSRWGRQGGVRRVRAGDRRPRRSPSVPYTR